MQKKGKFLTIGHSPKESHKAIPATFLPPSPPPLPTDAVSRVLLITS